MSLWSMHVCLSEVMVHFIQEKVKNKLSQTHIDLT